MTEPQYNADVHVSGTQLLSLTPLRDLTAYFSNFTVLMQYNVYVPTSCWETIVFSYNNNLLKCFFL